jgi:hypothetical protein
MPDSHSLQQLTPTAGSIYQLRPSWVGKFMWGQCIRVCSYSLLQNSRLLASTSIPNVDAESSFTCMSSHPYVKGNSLVALTLLRCVSVIKLVPHLFSPSLYHHFPMALGHQRINTDEQLFRRPFDGQGSCASP